MIQHVTNPALERFFIRAAPFYWALWFVVSPLGYLTRKAVPWLANALHRLRGVHAE